MHSLTTVVLGLVVVLFALAGGLLGYGYLCSCGPESSNEPSGSMRLAQRRDLGWTALAVGALLVVCIVAR